MKVIFEDCEDHANFAWASAQWEAFDTQIAIKILGEKGILKDTLSQTEESCKTYEHLFSRTIPTSDISRVNASGGEWTPIDPRTADVLRKALHYCKVSEGSFDITIGSLCEKWDFKNRIIPDSEELRKAAEHVNWEKVDLVAQCGGNWFARISDPFAHIDLGGIAKGWIADNLGESVARQGVEAMIINLGGNVLVKGRKPDKSPWKVGIIDPRDNADRNKYIHVVRIDEGSVVTSGTYIRGFKSENSVYHHILDPKTGLPVPIRYPSVSVVAEKSMDAEGFSTTMLALGLEKSRDLAKRHPEIIQAYFISEKGTIELLRP